ncbi:MAG: imidazole glycerol phosphate synthase subunit HisF [Pseudomonadota bacterium]
MSGLTKRIIPCLDVDNGRVVKGINFENMRDMGDPVELAKRYEDEGADEIVFLDITASADNRKTALNTVKSVANCLSIPFTLGGGLRSLDDMYAFLDAGADKVALNTSAVVNPELISEGAMQFGSQCIVVAIDIKAVNQTYPVFTHGGKKATDKQAETWAREVADRGAGEILLTCMHKDGTETGFDTVITGKLAKELSIQVIASGGASHELHLYEAFRDGADAVLAATMFHSGAYRVDEVKKKLHERGILVRI